MVIGIGLIGFNTITTNINSLADHISKTYEQVESKVSAAIKSLSISHDDSGDIEDRRATVIDKNPAPIGFTAYCTSNEYKKNINTIHVISNVISRMENIYNSNDKYSILDNDIERYRDLISKISQSSQSVTAALHDLVETRNRSVALAEIDRDLDALFEPENQEFWSIIKSRVHHDRGRTAAEQS